MSNFRASLKDGFKNIAEVISGLKPHKARNVGYTEFMELLQTGKIDKFHVQYSDGDKIEIKSNTYFDGTVGILYDRELQQKRLSLTFGIAGHPNLLKRLFATDRHQKLLLDEISSQDNAYLFLARSTQTTTGTKKHIVLKDGEIVNVVWEPELFRINIVHKQQIEEVRTALALD